MNHWILLLFLISILSWILKLYLGSFEQNEFFNPLDNKSFNKALKKIQNEFIYSGIILNLRWEEIYQRSSNRLTYGGSQQTDNL